MPNHTSCFHDVLSVQTILDSILEELETMTQAIDPSQLEQALSCLQNVFDAHKIFLAGAGRSGLVASLFANRLVHLGFRVNRVGEITAGPISKDDLLIVISGSGKTASLLAMVEKAKFSGAHLLLITLNPSSPMAQEASCIVLPGSTRLDQDHDFKSLQPVGSCFEQLAFLVCEALVCALKTRLGLTDEDLLARHANLE